MSSVVSQAGRMKSGETVLVTAAAGGTGQFAVQVNFLDFLIQIPADCVIGDFVKCSC
jgi:NADPH-dependent curcumin reductase CurA